MKRSVAICLVVVILFGIFMSVFPASAAITCDSEDEIILKLSGILNAHAEIWEQENFEEQICYNRYFEGDYLSHWDPAHECEGGNVVLRLSDATNAHAEGPAGSSQSYFNVCYGDLACEIITSGNCSQLDGGPPQGGLMWTTMFSISDLTNAHVAKSDFYPYQVCCKNERGVSPICDYDGDCETENGEDDFNCPTDCHSVCGDGAITGLELCDIGIDEFSGGTDDILAGATCTNIDSVHGLFAGGNLSCDYGCYGYNTVECIKVGSCGNGTLDPGEECEVGDTQECQTYGGEDGLRYCDNCQWSLECVPGSGEGYCGNGIIDSGEDCDCGSDGSCNSDELDDEECDTQGYLSGDLECNPPGDSDECTFNFDDCVGEKGFCEDNAPFVYEDELLGGLFAPLRCADYNLVYEDEWDRRLLCLYDCVPGASDPVSNGYGGAPLSGYGCAWDSNEGECYFSFGDMGVNECRVEYISTEECGPDQPFRTVEVIANAIGGSWDCDAGCGLGVPCSSQIPCPKVVQLNFFGWMSFTLSILIVGVIYFYRVRENEK